MSGIAGVVRLASDVPPPTREEAFAMAERLRHRGPDGRTAWLSPSGRCALGHAHLEVIDVETGDQPVGNEDGTVQVVFNGEIYNFVALRAELEWSGHRFHTRSDTEVLAHGYEAWGDELPEHLDGMFAFAVWDETRGRMLLARDHAGQKPLFWTCSAGRLAFASEIKALLTLGWVHADFDPAALAPYLAFGYVPAPGTFYRGIAKLAPATTLAVEPGGELSERRYWRLHWTSARGDPNSYDLRRTVRDVLGRAVERRLVADVPLGAFLSGDIDSTLVVGLMRERIDGPIRTFSLGFADDPTHDRAAYAHLAARRFDTEHTAFTVEAGAVDLVDQLVEAYDEPLGDSSAIATHIVSGLAREHVTVALTGDGGDGMFAGHPRFRWMVRAGRLPRCLTAPGRLAGHRLRHHRAFRHPAGRFARFCRAAALPADERMLRWVGLFGDGLEMLLQPELRAEVSRADLLASFRKPWEKQASESTLARTLALNFETYLPEDLLVKADRCSMAHGLALRSPFLDAEVVTLASSLPNRARIRRTRLQSILRTTFRDLLPNEIAARGRVGSRVPLPVWFRTHWRPLFEDRVLGPDARLWRWLQREPVQAMWAEHQADRADWGHQLWALLTLETWLRERD